MTTEKQQLEELLTLVQAANICMRCGDPHRGKVLLASAAKYAKSIEAALEVQRVEQAVKLQTESTIV